MSVENASLLKRHALKVALVYLLIRCLPEVVFYVIATLPDDTVQALVQTHGAWLRHIYPVLPLQILNVPLGFQHTLALLPVLLIEVLLVFLFSAWFLSRRPWTVQGKVNSRSWILLILATLIWSFVIRLQALGYFQGLWIEQFQAIQASHDNWYALLPPFMMKASWSINTLLYATTPLWAWVPTWLHFRSMKKTVDTASTAHHANATASESALSAPLQRAVVFAAFLLGCLVLHTVLVMATYLGLWPWTAELAKIQLPMAALNQLNLPLSLGQVVFASLVCALAAAIYSRRLTIVHPSAFQLVVKPLIAGAVAYLLTSFLMLALLWFLVWADPALTHGLTRQFSRDPQSTFAYAIVLNVLAMIVLCIMSGRMRRSPRRWTGVLAFLVLCASIPVYVGWTLAGSNMGTAGGQPGMAVTGTLGDARWRNMEQWCTGVAETAHGTWLIGRNEVSRNSSSYIPAGVPDLSKLLINDDDTSDQRNGWLSSSDRYLTTLSLLQADGTFKMMATIPDVACFVVSPTTETLFLLTGIDTPPPPSEPSSVFERRQTAIFRSTDHGVTWEWLKSGFMSDVNTLAWSVKPVFTSDKEVWAWGQEPDSEGSPSGIWGSPAPVQTRQDANGRTVKPTALSYSSDQGQSSTVLYSPEPLVASTAYLREITSQPDGDFSSRRDMDQERFVVQINDTHAYAWVSEFMWYRVGDDDNRRFTLTTRAELTRPNAASGWQITKVTRQPGLRLKQLSTSLDGRTYAVMQDKDGEWLAKLDTGTGEWTERHQTPTLLPSWLVEDRTSTRYFWNNGDYQVVSQWGDTVVPRAIIPFLKEQAEIDTDAHFYTRDGGRTWHHLAIPGYLGVMGLSPRGSKLYWSKGNWYTDDAPLQWQYDLAQ